MMTSETSQEIVSCHRYEIRLQGILEDKWLAWLGDGVVSMKQSIGQSPAGESSSGQSTSTVLACDIVDQAKLRGIVNKLWDLNLVLISLKRLEPEIPEK